MNPFERYDRLYDFMQARFADLLRACEHGYPTERLTQLFFQAEAKWKAEGERVLRGV